MNKTAANGVPRYIYFVIVAILALMYYYAAFVDTSPAENAVEDFYTAYFNRDYAAAAQNLSVFWAVQFLPQYQSYSPEELIKNRDKIIKEITEIITEIESKNKIPSDLSIKIQKKYSKREKNSAVVAYSFVEKGKEQGMEVAILIYEKGGWRIISFSPTAPEAMEQITKQDMKDLDKQFSELTKSHSNK
ncbi:hypothetical protein [Thermosyntropha sp.]|uniref:hypothetical protein n=1 Tax=Thermosyntropha sp. TaxID=2740820 RepID=UPI0025E2F24C|nr:hypothetical protein [Thermosyntropha sp.]MBO8158108.1 hypothetical protein [Thermosyntropha sp.]